jgi:hypothetical protein
VFNVDDALLGASDSLSIPKVRYRLPADWFVPDAGAVCGPVEGITVHPLCEDGAAENICFAAFPPDTSACFMISSVNMTDTAMVGKALREEGGWYSRSPASLPVQYTSAVFRSGGFIVRQLMVQTSMAVVVTMVLHRDGNGEMIRVDFLARKQAYPRFVKVFESFIGAIIKSN